MFNIREIIRHNRATYYNFSTGRSTSLLLPYATKFLLAFLMAYLFANIQKDFLNVVITIYAILIGFSFNILFYLLSINKIRINLENDSLETQIRIEKTNKLADELFYNVSYFNISSICVIITTLLFFLFESRGSNFLAHIENWPTLGSYLESLEPYLTAVMQFFTWGYRVFFYLLLLESLDCFLRTIGRVSFYFQEKIKLQILPPR